jgi:hypothetical protein
VWHARRTLETATEGQGGWNKVASLKCYPI